MTSNYTTESRNSRPNAEFSSIIGPGRRRIKRSNRFPPGLRKAFLHVIDNRQNSANSAQSRGLGPLPAARRATATSRILINRPKKKEEKKGKERGRNAEGPLSKQQQRENNRSGHLTCVLMSGTEVFFLACIKDDRYDDVLTSSEVHV